MSENPYASPEFSGAPPSTPPHRALRAPAILILVLTVPWGLYLAAISIFVAIVDTSRLSEREAYFDSYALNQILWTIIMPIGILTAEGIIIAGAINMLKLRGYKTARSAAILCMLPICSAGFILGIPFGIWALIVLNRPAVKAAFR